MTLAPEQAPGAAGSKWTQAEVALVVADYLAMWAEAAAGRPYNKKARNRALQGVIGRSAGSIEFKHQNVSAVLAELGLPWSRGYKPCFNFRDELIEELERQMPALARLPEAPFVPAALPEATDPFVSPPVRREGRLHRALERFARRFDPAEHDRSNRALGLAGRSTSSKSKSAAGTGPAADTSPSA